MNSRKRIGILERIRNLALLPAIVFAAVAPALADVQLGRFTCTSTSAARSLKTSVPLARSLGSAPRLRFVNRVGGVGFDGVAVPAEELKIRSLALAYDPSRPDGERMVLMINGEEVTANIPDWQLIPISRYAASDSTSCFTLFGELEDKAEEEALKKEGHKILNYDDAFRDTLLGLRLFQLDVMLLDDDFAIELPKDEEGNYLIGSGESEPDRELAVDALLEYEILRDALEIEGDLDGFDTDRQSWVITDHGVEMTFAVEDGILSISGEPFYYFWKNDDDAIEREEERAFSESMRLSGLANEGESYEQILRRILETREEYEEKRNEAFVKLARGSELMKPNEELEAFEDRLLEERVEFQDKINEALFEIGKAEGALEADDTEESFGFSVRLGLNEIGLKGEELMARRSLNARLMKAARDKLKAGDPNFQNLQGRAEALYEEADKQLPDDKIKLDQLDAAVEKAEESASEALEAYEESEDATGVYLKQYSERHVTLSKKLAQVNPEVWNAGRMTLRFGAFFRYCKENHPTAWASFLEQVEKSASLGDAQPKVVTPTVLKTPD